MRGPRLLAIALACVAALLALVLSACGEDGTGGPAAYDAAPAYEDPGAGAGVEPGYAPDCSDFYTWREAQEEPEADPALEEYLDEDLDGVACNELAQQEYEDGWASAYPEACEAAFFESPDGVLYLDGVPYEAYECEGTDPGPRPWEADAYSEPEEDGSRDAWETACDEFFNGYVGGDLYWGDDIAVGQVDCELASPY